MLPSCVKLMGSCAFGSLCLIVSHCLIKILVDSQWLADNKLKVGYFFWQYLVDSWFKIGK